MSDYTKPWVYNPRVAEERIRVLEEQVDKQMWSIIRLKEENTNLKLELERIKTLENVIDGQHKTIETYHKIFTIQEAELKKYREGKHNETN